MPITPGIAMGLARQKQNQDEAPLSPNGHASENGSKREKPLRRQSDKWLDKWLATCADLARLKDTHPMLDAVVDEIDGRWIRIGDQWLADFASCNYLGFDLDREIIDAVPAYLEAWGTHPSWSQIGRAHV